MIDALQRHGPRTTYADRPSTASAPRSRPAPPHPAAHANTSINTMDNLSGANNACKRVEAPPEVNAVAIKGFPLACLPVHIHGVFEHLNLAPNELYTGVKCSKEGVAVALVCVVGFERGDDAYRTAVRLAARPEFHFEVSYEDGSVSKLTARLRATVNKQSVIPLYTIPKPEIPRLPRAHFHGQVFLVERVRHLNSALNALLHGRHVSSFTAANPFVLGFDMEWRPSHQANVVHPTAMLQLCNGTTVVLIRISRLKHEYEQKFKNRPPQEEHREPTPFRLPPPLVAVLECSHIHKVGVGTSGDAGRLLGEFPNVKLTGFYDAMDFPITDRIRPHSLVGLMAIFFGVHVSKAARMTNWSAFKLTDAQLQYAALDAWASLLVYTRLSEVPYIIE